MGFFYSILHNIMSNHIVMYKLQNRNGQLKHTYSTILLEVNKTKRGSVRAGRMIISN